MTEAELRQQIDNLVRGVYETGVKGNTPYYALLATNKIMFLLTEAQAAILERLLEEGPTNEHVSSGNGYSIGISEGFNQSNELWRSLITGAIKKIKEAM